MVFPKGLTEVPAMEASSSCRVISKGTTGPARWLAEAALDKLSFQQKVRIQPAAAVRLQPPDGQEASLPSTTYHPWSEVRHDRPPVFLLQPRHGVVTTSPTIESPIAPMPWYREERS